MISIDEMQDMLEEITEEVPKEFFEELNGGIILLPEAVSSPEDRGKGIYVLGEYITDHIMGRYIAIYYGSFVKLFSGETEDVIRRELRETLFHEFTHHMEGLAGEYGLEVKDRQEMERYLTEGEEGYVWSPKLRGWRRGRNV